MKKFTKILSLILCLVMALGVLVSCKSNQNGEQNNNAADDKAQALEGDFYDENGLYYVALDKNKKTCAVSVGNAKSLKEIVIPETYHGFTVTTIAQAGFANCENLESVTIPATVESIDSLAFQNCEKLAEIKIAENSSLKAIGAQVFENTMFYNTAANWENNALYIGNYLITVKTSVTSCTVKDGTQVIAGYAFYNCASLKKVELPASLKYIGVLAFNNCENLTDVCITDLKAWCAMEFANHMVNPLNGKNKVLYVNGVKTTELVFTEEITTINAFAFYGYQKLSKVTFSTAIQTIGESAFKACVLDAEKGKDENGANVILAYKVLYQGSETQWKKVSKTGAALPSEGDIYFAVS